MDDKNSRCGAALEDNVTEAVLASELDELMADPDPEKLSDAFYRSLSFARPAFAARSAWAPTA